MCSSDLLVLLAGFAAGIVLHRAIPVARACLAPVDTGASYDLSFIQVTTDADAAAQAKEEARWTPTATLDLTTHTIALSDGTALVFE